MTRWGVALAAAISVALVAAPAGADLAPAGTTPKAKQVKLGCALKKSGILRFVTSSRQCRARVGKLVRLDPGPAEVCVRTRGTIKPRTAVAARRMANQVAACGKKRKPGETRLKLPSARDEFFCVERKSKAMRWFDGRPKCRKRGKLAEFAAFVAKAPPLGNPPGPGNAPSLNNNAPRAQDDSATASEDAPVGIAVLANDADPDGDPLALGTVDTTGTSGAIAVTPAGAVTFDPAAKFDSLRPGQTVTDSFAYTAKDARGGQSAPALVQVTVTGVDDAPRVAAGAAAPSTFTEDQAGQVPVDAGITVSDVDSDVLSGATVAISGGRTSGDALQFTGTPAIDGTYDAGTGVLTLTGNVSPAEYQDALRSVTFSTSSQDPGTSRAIEFRSDGSAPAAREVVVTPVNDKPVAGGDRFDGAQSAIGNTSLVVNDPSDGPPDPAGPQKTVTGDVLADDSDVDGPALSVRPETVTSVAGGQVVIEADGDFTYMAPHPCNPRLGEDGFNYTVEDNHPTNELTATGEVRIVVLDCVWYVDDGAAGSGDGQSDSPYNSLAELDGGVDRDSAGQTIFLYDGTYTGGLPLEPNQKLFTEKHGLTAGGVALEPADGAGSELQGGLQLSTRNDVQGLDLGTTGSPTVFALSGTGVVTADVNDQTAGGIDNPAGGAVNITAAPSTVDTIDVRLDGLTSQNSSGPAVSLTRVNGTFSAPSGELGLAAGTATVFLDDGSLDFTYGGNVADDGTVVAVRNKDGGTVDFNGGVSSGAVSLQNNSAGTTTRFDGGMVLSTGTSNAFSASNGGTLAITDANGSGSVPDNTIATTTGQPLNVTGTTIHSDDLTFRRISSDGAASGITLSSTGSAGGLNVTGSGGTCTTAADCTGGAIQNSTGPGISLANVGGGVDLNRMLVHSGDDDGIRGSSVSGFVLRDARVTDNGNATSENGVDFTGLTGAAAFAADTVTGNASFNVSVANASGALDMDVTGGSYGNTSAANGEDGILIDANNSATQTLDVSGTAFSNNRGDHVQASTGSTGSPSQDVTIANTTMTSTTIGSPDIAGGGITISPAGAANVDARITGNNIQNAKSNAIRADTTGSATGVLDATITGNTIGTPGTARSGSSSANGVLIGANGAATVNALVSGNGIHQYTNTHGVLLQQGSGAAAKINATLTGNTLTNPNNSLGGAGGVKATAGITSGDAGVMCLDLGGSGTAANNLGGAGNEITSPSVLLDTRDIRVTQGFGSKIQFPSLGATTTDAAVATYLANRNTGSPSVSAVSSPANTGFQNKTSSCLQPSP